VINADDVEVFCTEYQKTKAGIQVALVLHHYALNPFAIVF
jgi:hypothetical protein